MKLRRRAYLSTRVANADLSAWLPNHAVLTKNEKISAVIPQASLPNDVSSTHEVWSLGDVSLLPGLVDAHCHMHCSATSDAFSLVTTETNERLMIRAADNMRRCLLSGTTTVRDLGSKNEIVFPLRSAIEAGVSPGPRIEAAGTPITITGGHCWFFGTQADTEDEVAKAVRQQVLAGASVIKIMVTGGLFTPTSNPRFVQYNLQTLRRAVIEADRMNLPVAGHTLSAEGIKSCVDSGIQHIIHSRWFGKLPGSGLEYDEGVVEQIVDQGLWVDPTLGHMMRSEELISTGHTLPRPEHWALSRREASDKKHVDCFLKMDDAGVRFTAGLDMGMLGGRHDNSAANTWAMCELLGWDEWRAIRAATAQTAEALGLESEIGCLRPGMHADMAAFDNDPSLNIRDLSIASSVVQRGKPAKISYKVMI